jgi:glutamyl-Q tRNA(Asp) synthetase
MAAALTGLPRLGWREEDPLGSGPLRAIPAEPSAWGDVVLARADVPASYHLAVVVDDAFQQVSDVVRGRDLQPATAVHRVLQNLLGLPEPLYFHHPLILDASGRKLSKSRGSAPLRALRAAGVSAEEVIAGLNLPELPAARHGESSAK